MNKLFLRAFALWLPFAVALTGVFGFAYWAVQQNYRSNLNDPQVQIVEDAASELAAGAVPASLTRDKPIIDLRTSLAPWVTVYDSTGTPLESTAVLDGAPPRLPQGVFNTSTWRTNVTGYQFTATASKEIIFSWQPRQDVRSAVALIQLADGRFVASGRNMREAEAHIAMLTSGTALVWSTTILATFTAIVFLLLLGWL